MEAWVDMDVDVDGYGWMDRYACMHACMHEWMDGCMHAWMDISGNG